MMLVLIIRTSLNNTPYQVNRKEEDQSPLYNDFEEPIDHIHRTPNHKTLLRNSKVYVG
jgi:hypothetical protein